MTHSPEVLAAAMAKVSRDAYWWPSPWMYSSLLRPSVPSKPPTTPTTEFARTTSYEAPVAVERPPVASEAVRAHVREQEVVPTWKAVFDMTLWRTSRPWWLRIAATLVVKRLNR